MTMSPRIIRLKMLLRRTFWSACLWKTKRGGRSAVRTCSVLAVAALLSGPAAAVEESTRDQKTVDVIFEFTGRSAASDILRLVSTLRKSFGSDILGSEPVEAQKGDTPCSLLQKSLQLPGCPEQDVDETFAAFNPQSTNNPIIILMGHKYEVPQIDLDTFTYTSVVDKHQLPSFHGDRVASITVLTDRSWQPFLKGSRSVASLPKFQVELEGRRLRLGFTSPEQAVEALRAFYSLDLESATAHTDILNVPRSNFSVSYVPPSKQHEVCPLPEGQEGAYWRMLDSLSDWEVPQCARSCESPGRCPETVLVDQTVHPHGDLEGKIVHLDRNGSPRDYLWPEYCEPFPAGESDQCSFGRFEPACHHGTSMASVIVSQYNGYGFAGMSPASPVVSFDWNAASTDDLVRLISARSAGPFQDLNHPQIYLFASKFPDPIASLMGEGDPHDFHSPSYPSTHVTDYLELRNPEDRTKLRLVTDLLNSRQLWIVAAGQPSKTSDGDTPDPIRLSSRSPFAPMNLGDQDFVIVVTACEECDWPDANIFAGANFADAEDSGFITIAAPGFGYLTARDHNSYSTEHGGTSQAAAFVAGVTSAMINCNLDRYLFPNSNLIIAENVKKRLVLTSRPVIQQAEGDRAVPSIVDPKVAIMDPGENWYMRRPQFADKDYRSAELGSWCKERLEFVGADGERNSVSTKNTLRIRAVPEKYWEDNVRRWYIYSSIGRTHVDIAGPVLFDSAFQQEPIIRMKDGTLALGDLDDLLLARHKTWQSCQ